MKTKGKLFQGIDLLSAFLLPAAIFLLILRKNCILPFGETTLLFSDLDSQYIEFMAEYRRILLGEGSLFYSWNAGLGMNFLALTAYYLASPFNFLLVLFSENRLPLAVSLITTLKLSCAGAAFSRFLQVRFRKTGLWIPLFSACYALNGWALSYAFNIMWLDALILLPLLCAGIEKLLRGERCGMAVLIPLFALSFISQFYMAFMTGVFCALYLLTRLIVAVDAPVSRETSWYVLPCSRRIPTSNLWAKVRSSLTVQISLKKRRHSSLFSRESIASNSWSTSNVSRLFFIRVSPQIV